MGKYIRKSKTTGEVVALMDVSQSSLGVLTRAKSLALQRLQKSPSPSRTPPASAPPPSPAQLSDGDVPYMELRSRRLQKKPPILVIRSGKRRKQRTKPTCEGNPNPNSQKLDSSMGSLRRPSHGSSGSDSVSENVLPGGEKDKLINEKEITGQINKDLGVEASFGENLLELEGRERTTRESTPCSLIRDPETIRTPSSSTKANNGVNNTIRREQGLSTRLLPTTHEMEEFFSGAEEEQQRQFIEKYNYDPVNDKPLHGRYEWKKVDH